ncbi:PDZ domain-containing protein [Rothia sp. P3C3.S176]|uniref:YlbL family protein n=1 Tax=Rothia sp. P3C3.S176 TaxID=2962204 RepID=UPI0020C89EB9|nr:PDZ domain-containing protein [Rothia sp. P3C3.S176]MCP8994943.1 PDZ domain-containing protein [Rothia sp. P3C3.S176]
MTKSTLDAEQQPNAASASVKSIEKATKRRSRFAPRRVNLRSVSAVATCALLAGAFVLPSSYVKEGPGPLFDVLGTYQEKDVIEVSGAPSYKTFGKMNMTTVSVSGGPYTELSGAEAFYGWLAFDGNRSLVVPTDALYPHVSHEQATAATGAQMADSQTQAKVAAMRQLKMAVTEKVQVLSTVEGSPAASVLKGDDRIVKVGEKQIETLTDVPKAVNASNGSPIDVTVERGGTQQTFKLTPVRASDDSRWILGAGLKQSYDLPAHVQYNLDGVGGPSAGLMLALGTVDKLSEGTLLADEDAGGDPYRSYISGTGTIDANGKVGAIGGIKYKILATGRYGARYFLAPKENCDSIVKMQAQDPDLFNYYHAGQVRGTMVVVPVSTLDEAVKTVEAIKSGTPDDSLPRCGS